MEPPADPAPAEPTSDRADPVSAPADQARAAALERVVRERTREERARVVRRGEYEALLVRGSHVNHAIQARNLGLAAVIGFVGAIFGFGAGATIAFEVAIGCAVLYALFWLFLYLTGGEEFDLVAADESGHVTIERSGRLVETRGIVLRIGVPVIVLVAAVVVAIATLVSIANPPPPSCNAWPSLLAARPDACIAITDPGATVDPATGRPGVGAVFSVSQAQTFDALGRLVRLGAAVAIGFGAALFLWTMLTGRHFLTIAPIEWPRGRRRRD